MKAAIIILSDPKTGSEEALGRLFNGLAAAWDFKQKGDEVTILFQGTGTCWVSELTQIDHPAHALYNEIKDNIAGASSGCADVFGAKEDVQKHGFELIGNNPLPSTSGLPSLQALITDGYTVLNF